jgi:CHAT domain-containing protein/tetratricopeptide (TPR) repeat protein
MSDGLGEQPPHALAEIALDLIDANPEEARRLAERALALAVAAERPQDVMAAHQALGAAAAARHDVRTAVTHLTAVVDAADAARLRREGGLARIELANVLTLANQHRAALTALAAAARDLDDPRDRARVKGTRARVLYHEGRLRVSLTVHTEVLAEFRSLGDRRREAGILHNRALVHAELGLLAAAEADLAASERILWELGEERFAVDAQVNLGWVLARRGDLPGALAWFDRADRWLEAHQDADPEGLVDRAEVFIAARLLPEALAAATEAEAGLRDHGSERALANARLHRSEAALLAGDLAQARQAAEGVQEVISAGSQPALAALSRYALLRVDRAELPPDSGLLRRARATAAALDTNGWTLLAADAHLIAADLALSLNRSAQAREELHAVTSARRGGPIQLRSRAWHAEALARLADGDRRGAETALRAGFSVLRRYRAALGATELRAVSSRHGAELADVGIGLALQDGDATRTLRWAERYRASVLAPRPVRPPDDPVLAADLERLRTVAGQIGAAVVEGKDTARLRSRQAQLEDAVRRRSWLAAAPSARAARTAGDGDVDLAAVRSALGDRVLVELIEHGERLYAVVLSGRRPPRLHRLGETAQARRELDALRYAVRRRSTGQGRAGAVGDISGFLHARASRLADQLLGPIMGDLADRPAVIVPTGELHAVPWAALPGLAERELSVAPSAAAWLRAATPGAGPDDVTAATAGGGAGVVLVCGPGLPEAAAEVADLAGQYPAARVLVGERASSAAVLEALEGASLAHLGAHGSFRSDNPLFSALHLADGPLTVYDLERLTSIPRWILLSACDTGLSDVHPGDELMGITAALLSLGSAVVIGAVAPVPDDAARRLMAPLHAYLGQGLAPAAALAQARTDRLADEDPTAADVFVCFGAG